jgi:hypothetical protein
MSRVKVINTDADTAAVMQTAADSLIVAYFTAAWFVRMKVAAASQRPLTLSALHLILLRYPMSY